VNTTAPATGNLALRFEGGTLTATDGGSFLISNGNPDPATQGVLVQFGNNNPMTVNGSLTIGSDVQVYFRSSPNPAGAGAKGGFVGNGTR
jgi:hypothetical protein